MTNKKFKIAAMSLALTACVAATPLAANAAGGADASADEALEKKNVATAAEVGSGAATEAATPTAEPAALTEEPEKVEESKKDEEPEKVEESKKDEEPEKVEKSEKDEEPKKVEESKKDEEPEKVEESKKNEEPEKVEKSEKDEEPKKVEESKKDEEPEKVEESKKDEEPEKVEESKKDEETEKVEESKKPEEAAKPAEVVKTEEEVEKPEVAAPAEGGAANAAEDEGISDLMDEGENAPSKEVSTGAAEIHDENDGFVASYDDLKDAIAAATERQTVVLQKDHAGSVEINKSVTLDLNQHKIDAAGTGAAAITVKKSETDDRTAAEAPVVVIKNGTVTGGEDSGVKVTGETNVQLKDLNIKGNSSEQGGGVYIKGSKDVTIDHCTIEDNKTTKVGDGNLANGYTASTGAGGGVYISSGSVTIKGSTIQNNTGTRGGGVFVEKGSTVKVEMSEIKNNIATEIPSDSPSSNYGLGGGIYSYDSKLTITGGTISGNEAKGSTSLIQYNEKGELSYSALGNGGGGICAVGKDSDVTLDGVTVTDNKASSNASNNLGAGGGIEAQGGKLTVNNSTISGNDARGNGGGIASAEGNVLNVSGSTIQSNKGNNGGGIHTGEARDTSKTPSKVTITDTKILDNEITGSQGGGVYVGTRANATLKDCTVAGNKADTVSGMGGGVSASGVGFDLTLDNVKVENNTANGTNGVGGGVSADSYVANPGKITLKNGTTIKGNTATSGGGVYAAGPMTILAENTDVLNNSATGWAGGVFAYNGVVINAENTKFLNNTAGAAGGILLWSNSSATLNNSEVSGNKTSGNGGGVYVFDATCSLTTSNGTVFRDNSGYRGGGIFSSGGTVTIDDSTFEKNTATDDGGAIAATQNSSLTVRNSKVLENKAADTAGGILAEKSTLEVTDSIVDGNRASVGGGIYIADIDDPGETKEDKPEHTITRTEITNNTADGMGIGGGIYLGAQKLTITDSKLTGNNTITNNGQTQGGAIVAYSPGDFTLDNTLIQGNTADVGGGIHVLSTNLRDSHIILRNNTRITDNVAHQFGGGIFLDNMNNPAILELVNASVDNNSADVAGGIGNSGSIVILKDGAVLENNTAKRFAGGLYNTGKLTVESGATVMNNTAATYGGGLYNKGEAIVESGANLYNNHAEMAGDDVYLLGKDSTLTLTKVGEDWKLDDCGHAINGWFADLLDARWDADGKGNNVTNLKDYTADGLLIVENEDGSFTIRVMDENATLALKAAHAAFPKPEPDEPEEPTQPETPAQPETPQQPAAPEEPASPAQPEESAQTPAEVSPAATLPKTGVNWVTALAMALSGFALTAAGAFTSLFAKSRH